MARDTLLDYVFTAQAREVIGAASRSYLHNVLVIAPLASGATAGVYEVTSAGQVAQYTSATGPSYLLNAGMSRFYLCAAANIAAAIKLIQADRSKYFTILIDPAFSKESDLLTLDSEFAGVIGWTTSNASDGRDYQGVATANHTSFIDVENSNGANMYTAFGALLSAANWRNQQYIAMPAQGVTDSLGVAEGYFQDRLSFVLNSEEFGNRLAFFVNRGRAITAPYLYEEIQLDLQSWSLTYINANMPDYTDVEAAKMQSYLQKRANTKYVDTGLVEMLSVNVLANQDNFVMSGNVGISEPKATWRIKADITQGVEDGE